MADILKTTFTNRQDIDDFFKEKTGQNFVEYYNDNHAEQQAFGENNGKKALHAISDTNRGNWAKAWDSLDVIFDKESINLVEFLTMNTILLIETGYSGPGTTEGMGYSGHKGIAYPYDAISGVKSSYNVNTSLGNKTAYDLFNDADFIKAHETKAYGQTLKNTTDVAWQGKDFPQGWSGDVSLDRKSVV